ncbi:MAG TPA: metal ABC transporter ATP-binding protein [Acidimicrobiales bacterium]
MSDDRAPEPLLTVDNVHVAFGPRAVLDGVSFTIGRGEFTGLIGSNGAGKTTLLRVMLGLQRPDGGSVRLTELQPDRAPSRRRRAGRRSRAIGYVPQKILLDPDLPIRARDLVALGLDGHRYGLGRRSPQQRALVEQALHEVDADAFADRRVGQLSGGEQQRVLIAHALVGQPELLLLDEPLANLDPRSVQEVVALLHQVAVAHDIAILISAHEMNALLPVMDRIVYLTNGRAASGTTEEVVRSDILSALYGHHVDVLELHGRVLVVAEPGAERADIPDHPRLTLS